MALARSCLTFVQTRAVPGSHGPASTDTTRSVKPKHKQTKLHMASSMEATVAARVADGGWKSVAHLWQVVAEEYNDAGVNGEEGVGPTKQGLEYKKNVTVYYSDRRTTQSGHQPRPTRCRCISR